MERRSRRRSCPFGSWRWRLASVSKYAEIIAGKIHIGAGATGPGGVGLSGNNRPAGVRDGHRENIAIGRYHDYKSLAAPMTYAFTPYAIADGTNDFNVTSLRGNAVLRWEYMPGSTLYLVWTQTREDLIPHSGNFDLYLVNLDGSGLEQITFDDQFDGFPMFSPDGKSLVWASNRGDAAGTHDTNLYLADWRQ